MNWSYDYHSSVVEVRVPVGSKYFFIKVIQNGFGAHAVSFPISTVGSGISQGVKRLGREADHLTQISAKDKKTWFYKSAPPYVFMT
jgi:hypothetical protein